MLWNSHKMRWNNQYSGTATKMRWNSHTFSRGCSRVNHGCSSALFRVTRWDDIPTTEQRVSVYFWLTGCPKRSLPSDRKGNEYVGLE